ncbi:endo-1,4-beta-xylanase [Phytoactinopolyspora limicola]|uniref:endo-1,4-beta-xylanase n=1 Tax=Phytoactinopolyspora limicola TaxID=2715536 RepID=UPI0014083828|nr:endo-1,4-beta-xylanase [Phytoactinopolyspora limicola]
MAAAEATDAVSFSDFESMDVGIQANRTRECVLQVATPVGVLDNGQVRFVQTGHAFSFGGNAFGLGKMARLRQPDAVGRSDVAATVGVGGQESVDAQLDEVERLVADAAINRRVRLHGAEYDGLRDSDDLRYAELFARPFNLAVVPFYESAISPDLNAMRLHRVSSMIGWARARGLAVKGHPLVFQNRRMVPRELLEMDHDSYWRWSERRISTLLRRFGDVVDLWDCINEPLRCTPPGTPLEAVRRAFASARAANPRGRLTLNLCPREAFSPEHRRHSIELLQRALELGTEIDVLGVQGHFGRLNAELVHNIAEGLDALGEFGLPIHLTEITFKTDGPDQSAAEERQACDVESLYTYMFSRPEMDAMIWWDLTDRHSFCDVGGLVRRDLSPKPAYDVLTDLILQRWSTDVTAEIRGGQARFRGFFGTYEIEVRLPDGSTEHGSFTLRPGDDGPLFVKVGEAL